jgi:hypothetical protein
MKKYDYIKVDSMSMNRVFKLSVGEIEDVLSRKKAITDVTKVAAVTLSGYSRIKSTEIHEIALMSMLERKGEQVKAIA